MTSIPTLAETLWQARLDGTVVPKPDDAQVSAWSEGGYEVQQAIVQRAAERCVGWKVGSTSAEAQARLGTDEPGAGALLERFCRAHRATVPIFETHGVFVEAEFVLVMGKTLGPRPAPYTIDEVTCAVAHARPGLEFVGSRFEGGLAGIGRALITADGGGNVAFVEGEPAIPAVSPRDLAEVAVSLAVDGQVRERGTGARALGHPLNVVRWLANHLCRRGIALEAGERVSTGTCTGLVAVAPGQAVSADFGALGIVSARLEVALPSGE